jgi:putative DNA primase/helicase
MNLRDLFRNKMMSSLDLDALGFYAHSGYYDDNKKDKITRIFRSAIGKCSLIIYKGDIYIFSGCYYEKLSRKIFSGVLEAIFEDRSILSRFWDELVKMCYGKIVELEHGEIKKSVLCFTNGVVDFSRTDDKGRFVLEKFSPTKYVFTMLPYAYAKNTRRDLFNKFLREVLPDESVRLNLQEMCGCLFLDRDKYRLEKMAILYGDGANGKSVFASAISGVLGSDNVSHYDLKDLTCSADKEKNIMYINGKLLNYCTDSDDKAFNSPNLKSLISGEPQQGRKLYSDPEVARDIPMIFINTNNMPVLKDSFRAYARRINVYHFKVIIDKACRDIHLADKMKDEYSGILEWMIDGLYRFVGNGYQFTWSESVETFCSRLECPSKIVENTVLQFTTIKKIYPFTQDRDDKGEALDVMEAYTDYKRWCYENAVEHGDMSLNVFGMKMTKMGFKKFRRSYDDGKYKTMYRYYKKR